MTITRRHHPLAAQTLEVVTGGPAQIVVRIPDGTVMRVPRAWTDADGPPTAVVAERIFTIEALLELLDRVEAFRRRT